MGQHFGFPYCHQGDLPETEFGTTHACSEFAPPIAKLGPHSAALVDKCTPARLNHLLLARMAELVDALA